jgi:hypothetical protein
MGRHRLRHLDLLLDLFNWDLWYLGWYRWRVLVCRRRRIVFVGNIDEVGIRRGDAVTVTIVRNDLTPPSSFRGSI